jgi:hypothetical protein
LQLAFIQPDPPTAPTAIQDKFHIGVAVQLTRAIWTAQYPFFPSGGFSLLKLDLHLVNQFTVFGGKVMILLGTLHELFPEAILFVFHSFSLLNFKESSEVYRTFPDPPLASLQAPAHGSYP